MATRNGGAQDDPKSDEWSQQNMRQLWKTVRAWLLSQNQNCSGIYTPPLRECFLPSARAPNPANQQRYSATREKRKQQSPPRTLLMRHKTLNTLIAGPTQDSLRTQDIMLMSLRTRCRCQRRSRLISSPPHEVCTSSSAWLPFREDELRSSRASPESPALPRLSRAAPPSSSPSHLPAPGPGSWSSASEL